MDILIRRAEKKDCPALLGLIRELAIYERAPDEVTVTLQHFEESGFGAQPVWWGFVAELDGKVIGFA
ncbi:MAG: GNAT family N-acetyltransferase, partial [Bacteroidota bacterium]